MVAHCPGKCSFQFKLQRNGLSLLFEFMFYLLLSLLHVAITEFIQNKDRVTYKEQMFIRFMALEAGMSKERAAESVGIP